MATVTITLSDVEAGVEQEVIYVDGFDKNSPAHFMAALMIKMMGDEVAANNVKELATKNIEAHARISANPKVAG